MSESAVPGHPAPLTRRQIREAERAREAAEAAERERQSAEQTRRAAEEPGQSAGQTRDAARAEAREPETAQTLRRDLRAAAPAAGPTAGAAPAPAEAPALTSPTPAPSAGTPAGAWPGRSQEAALALGAALTSEVPAAVTATSSRRDTTDTEVLPTQERLLSRRDLRHASGSEPTRRPVQRAPRATASSAHGRSWAPRAAVLGAMGTLTIVAPLTGFAAPDAERAEAAAVVTPETSILDVLEPAAAAAVAPVPASLLKDPAASSRATVLQTSRAADRNALTCAPLDGASGARAAVTERTEQLVRPVADGTYRNSSHYGNRSHPLSGAYGFHTGTDYAAPLGTPIYAIANGTVEYVGMGKDGRSSMLVILRHEIAGQTVYSWYVHMYKDGIHVTEGQDVTAGDVIAEVGNNGNSTGPHLHFEIHLDDQGTTTDPLPWLEKQGAVEVSAVC
ncbi:murein DD-endopeptidase MepM/ murein hydrolase activator NlpD [Georgenia soli]|uniref:Murein DD-endopeptidase MepM/ murein hydrolase activator NlpD n=1 Tax=Georgenia soli TaxID=638953 RepID=A0A2A9EPZ7_9MICO|nr:M23 family metallopeptidase [Georgenia soli]PFG40676.1 murein DD-endopeptidase MepM/ murein hydrolase activator NlpD [Georgenia soli]